MLEINIENSSYWSEAIVGMWRHIQTLVREVIN